MKQIEAIRNGDQQVFAELFDQTYQKMFAFFMKRTEADRETSKDLTQLAYVKLWNSRHTLSYEHALEKQLFVIAKSTLVDHIRKEYRLNKMKGQVTQIAMSAGAQAATANFESNDVVLSILKKLPPIRKKILQLKMLYGYSNNEIASMMSISVKTVEDHVTKGLSELRKTGVSTVLFALLFFSY
ncbi:MAG: sigma-70 family RNA polymerase sigma factor [Filimonas sp.]|nr:sigma-70 family RNA polymerase sigma factor [Filimonas sp.]